MCTPQAGTAIFRTHAAFLRCLFVRGRAHTSLCLAIHPLLPEVKCSPSPVTGMYPFWELMLCWCLGDTRETEKQPFCFHGYSFSQERNKSEETLNWMEHCERRDDTARDRITRGVRSGHSNDYLFSLSLLSIAVGLEWVCLIWLIFGGWEGKSCQCHLLPVQHLALQWQQALWHYAALYWASQTLLLSPSINGVSVFHWLPFY